MQGADATASFSGGSAVKIAGNFSAVLRRAERVSLEAVSGRGKVRSFVGQDKGSAVRHGIFAGFSNDRADFSPRRRS